MEFRETTQEDLDFMADHSISRGLAKYQPEHIDYCYTLEHENAPLVIGGFRFINLTTAWCWVDLSDRCGSHITFAYRIIKGWMNKFVKEHQLKRLQAYIECDFPEAIRMAEHLGFKQESIMENFVDDKNAYMYVRLM